MGEEKKQEKDQNRKQKFEQTVTGENAISAPSFCAVYIFIKRDSPANALPIPFITPPLVVVFISIPQSIQLIPPFSAKIDSPFCNLHITAGNVSPIIFASIFIPPFILYGTIIQ